MNSKKLFLLVLLFFVKASYSQNEVTEIQTNSGVHYIRTTIDYPITGTYLFNGGEPTVELNANGSGFYQLHEQPKRAVTWGIECKKTGEVNYLKGFNSAKYTLWYKYNTFLESDTNKDWIHVEFTIHFNTLKMYIQGEREKSYTEEEETKSKQ